jgi:hypothetical protein
VTPDAAKRELALAVAGCTASGALLLFVADDRAADAWGWVAFGGVVAIAASRRASRVVVGVALALAGAVAAVSTGAVVAGALLALTGAFVAVRGPRWSALGARYDAPARRADPWDALDRGEDPTA